ncbi:MAG: hypothetical protein KDJ15_06205, partial [Alphaproteobacteria bacterium]|nr:hypothetical protein [Alphaproteobacteria bacterium]
MVAVAESVFEKLTQFSIDSYSLPEGTPLTHHRSGWTLLLNKAQCVHDKFTQHDGDAETDLKNLEQQAQDFFRFLEEIEDSDAQRQAERI